MIRKIFAGSLLALALMVPAFAQEITPEMTQEAGMLVGAPRLMNTVEEIVPQVSTDNTLELLIRGRLMDGCDLETVVETERVNNVWFVDLYRNNTGAPCTKALLPFAVTVDATELLTLDQEAFLPDTVVVNGTAYRLNRAMIEPMPGTNTAPIVPPMLEPLAIAKVMPETVVFGTAGDGTHTVQLIGNLNDSCQRLVARSHPFYDNPTVYRVEVYSVFGLADMCAMGLVPFDLTLTTDADAELVREFVINGVSYVPDNTSTALLTVVPVTVLGTAILESMPPQISLELSAQIDGCPQQPQIAVTNRVDNTIHVDVVRVLPPVQACTMNLVVWEGTAIVPTTGMSIPGTVTIFVNGEPVEVEVQ